MVEHDIQDDFNVIVMKRFDQLAQLRALAVEFDGGRVAGVRCEKADRIVAPVFEQSVAVYLTHIHALIEFKNRHELNGIDSQFFEVGNFFLQTGIGALVLDAGGRMSCKASHVQLVNDKLAQLF